MEIGKKQELELEAKEFFQNHKKEIIRSIKYEQVVNIDFEMLSRFSPRLSEKLLENPEEIIALLEVSLEEQIMPGKSPRIRFTTLPESVKIKIKEIRAKHLDQFIIIEGIVRQSSDVRPQVVNARFECPTCGAILSVLQIDRKFREPSRCSCGRKGLFKLLSKEMVDAQRLVIEESPDSLEGGEQPRRMNVFLKEDLVDPKMEDRTTPGSKVKIIGVLKEVPVPLPQGSISTRFDLAVEANNAIPLEETFDDLEVNETDEEEIKKIATNPKVFEKLVSSIAPSVYGFKEVKEAILLQLFSGVKKKRSDGGNTRGDIHVLLVGDPGVAKSVTLKFVSRIAPKGRYVSGKATTGAGLCVAPNSLLKTRQGEVKIIDFVEEKLKVKKEYKKGIWKQEVSEIGEVLTLNKKPQFVKPNVIWKLKVTDSIQKVILTDGKHIEVTPNTKLLVKKENKEIWTESNLLKSGMLIAVLDRDKEEKKWVEVDTVIKLSNPGYDFVYDITIPKAHCFIANDILVHNTASVIKDEFLKGWSLEAGAMVLANKGLIAVDEIEKMDEHDRSTMHEAMESQTVTISKANIQATLRSETSVLAAGNPKLGRFDPVVPIPQQINISPALLSRFDVIFILRDMPNRAQDEAIASHVLEEHKQGIERDVIDPKLLRKYVAYARKIKPKLTDEAADEIKEFYISIRNKAISSTSEIKAIPITARQLEAIVRLSEACAKIRLSNFVQVEDAKRAISLLKYSMMQVGFDEETQTFDVDRITTGIPTSKRSKIIIVRETISKLESSLGKLIPVTELEKELGEKMSKEEIEDAINQLSKSGDIFKPKTGFIQKL